MTAEFDYLSGIVNTMQSGLTQVEGQILALPTNSDLNTQSAQINGRLNTIDASNADNGTNIALLIQEFAYLKDTISNIDTILIAHTGSLTGNGVHGHS